jgi:hypothetical protein
MKLEFSRQIVEKYSKYEISWKSDQWEPSCSTLTNGLYEANSRFFNFANVHPPPPQKKAGVAGSDRTWRVTWRAEAVLPRHCGVKLAEKNKALVSTKCDVRVECESRNIYLGGRFQETRVAASQMSNNVSSLILLLFMALL